jgi:putative Ca2+/H+ antiporter (TMEM165/GDT1 family)
MFEALAMSTALVTLAEIGDKTQLLSLVLAARFRRPRPIIAGIFVATLANHTLAGALGAWITAQVGADVMRWVLGLSFLAMAAWTLKPDTLDDGAAPQAASRWGVFATTTLAFFIAEMGDKTQLATVALAARYDALVMVVVGTTLGMLAANVPVVLVGERLVRRLPLAKVRIAAAALFALLGGLALSG